MRRKLRQPKTPAFSPRHSPMRSPLAWVLVFTLLAGALGWLQSIDRLLYDTYAALMRHQVDSDLVIVEIDADSLRRLDHWPWPRRHHAGLIDRLREAGAGTVFYDVDFSSPSGADDDRLLAEALARFAPGAILLPAFSQPGNSIEAAATSTAVPLPPFRAHALLAPVDMRPDRDGFVRRLPAARLIDGEVALPAGVRMSGLDALHESIIIDYSIDPRSFTRLSFADVLAGDFDAAVLRGRHVAVGATALELGDLLPVPVYRSLPGVVVQALAYETLRSGPLRSAPVAAAIAITLLLFAVMVAVFRHSGWRGGLLFVAFAATTLCALSLVVLARQRIMLPASMPLTLLLSGYASFVVSLLERETRERRRQRELISYRARHDALTGLGNRYLLGDALERVNADEAGASSLLLIDLDHFKEINDALGHDSGDQVLRQVAKRFSACVDDGFLLSRVGGDEFAVFIRGDDSGELAHRCAERLLDTLRNPFAVGDLALEVGASIGIARYPVHARDGVALMQYADSAMYAAKRDGSGKSVYDPALAHRNALRIAISTGLRQAMTEDRLSLYYQPKLDIAAHAVAAAEALLRWEHSEWGFIPPEEIVEVAENTGLIWPLTEWTLRRALTDAQRWRRQGHRIRIAVNLSARLLHDRALVEKISACLADLGSHPRELTLEITESAIMVDPALALDNARALHAAGIELSIDDFGTGYSSLEYLRNLPATELKLDKSFVMEMLERSKDALIVKSTIELAHGLGLRMVAEGVESAVILAALREMGCDLAQGYHISRPQPGEEMDAWLDAFGSDHDKLLIRKNMQPEKRVS